MKVPNVIDLTTASVISDSSETKSKMPWFGVRHLQFMLLFLILSATYAMRVNMSVAVVAMTDAEGTNPNFAEYDWDESTRSLLLSSFFWGYVIMQVPSAEIARRFGGRVTLAIGVGICCLLNIITPWAASIGGWKLIMAARIISGLSQGVIFPSLHTLIAKWSPLEERGFFTTLTYSGAQFGTFLMFVISGVLSTSPLGWPSLFYIPGAFGILFVVLYLVFGDSTPSQSRFISNDELKLIESSFSLAAQETVSNEPKKLQAVPWFHMLTSPAFLVVCLSHMGHNWGFWTLLTEIPTYVRDILGQDIKSNAILSSLPYLVMFLMCIVYAFVASMLDKYKCMSLIVTRKVFNTIGLWGPMLPVLGLGFMTLDNVNLAIVLLCVATGLNSADYLGFQTNHIDLSPNYAGIMMGITNCLANIMSIGAPLLVGFVVTDNSNVNQWRNVFYIATGYYFLAGLMYLIFGKCTLQPWDDPEQMKKDKRKNNTDES